MKLTSANGIDLPEGKNDAIIFDSALRGFAIRVRRLSGGRIDRNSSCNIALTVVRAG